jgi:hypothetical protein
MRRGYVAALLVALGLAALASLLSGTDFLARELPGGLPLGNGLAALCLCTLAGAAVLLASSAGARGAAWAGLCAALAWLPVSIGLAGNAALNFGRDDPNGPRWLWASFALLLYVLAVLLVVLVLRGVSAARRWRRAR